MFPPFKKAAAPLYGEYQDGVSGTKAPGSLRAGLQTNGTRGKYFDLEQVEWL